MRIDIYLRVQALYLGTVDVLDNFLRALDL